MIDCKILFNSYYLNIKALNLVILCRRELYITIKHLMD